MPGKTPHLRRRNWLDLSKNNRALLFVSWGFYGLLQRHKLETLVQVSNHLYSHPSSSSLSKSQSQFFCPFSLSLHPSLCCNELSIISLLSTLASSAINSLCQMWPHARSDSQEPCSLRHPPSGTSLTHIYIIRSMSLSDWEQVRNNSWSCPLSSGTAPFQIAMSYRRTRECFMNH